MPTLAQIIFLTVEQGLNATQIAQLVQKIGVPSSGGLTAIGWKACQESMMVPEAPILAK